MPRTARYFLAFALALLVVASTAAERVTYFVPDAQGSPVAAMDAQGNLLWRESYAPYGQRQAGPAENNARPAYTGKPEDADTGLVYMGARAYDPETARFTGIDPQGFSERNPQSFGRYVYANNSPYRYLDPDGEAPSPADLLLISYDAGAFAFSLYAGDPVGTAEAAADLRGDIKGLMVPIPAAGLAFKAARAADKAEGTGRVFWSGGRKSREAAEQYAKENGKKTLEMTPKGRWLDANQGSLPVDEVQGHWSDLSRDWAEGAAGEVDVFIHQPRYDPSRNWGSVEKPVLLQNVEVTKINYHDVN